MQETALNKKVFMHQGAWVRLKREIWKYKLVYLLMLPGLIYFVIFKYLPMFGIIIAFKDVTPGASIEQMLTGPWAGFRHFKNFFTSYYFWSILKNTILIHLYGLIFGFPCPIILALLLNELRVRWFTRTVQTISYMPHFLSTVVMAGLITSMLSPSGGLINEAVKLLGGEPVYFLADPRYFRSILVISGIWQGMGWGSILYLAAITGIDVELYDAAVIDGAGRFQKMWYITIPGMSFIIVLNLILNIGNLLDAGFEKVLLLYSPTVYDVGDIIDTYVYRMGLVSMNYSYSAAVGLFKSVVALILVISSDRLAKRMGQRGIW